MIATEKLNCKRREIQIAKELENVIFQIEALIRYCSYDVYHLCEKSFSEVKEFNADSFREIRESFSENFLQACEISLKNADKCTKSAFMRIADFLGMFESGTQIAGLENVLDEIRSNRISMENEFVVKRKLYLCLGIFSGIVICLILM